jgi:hypothetical protein
MRERVKWLIHWSVLVDDFELHGLQSRLSREFQQSA